MLQEGLLLIVRNINTKTISNSNEIPKTDSKHIRDGDVPGDDLNKIFEMRKATFHLTKKDKKEYGMEEFKSKEHFLEWRMLMIKRGYRIEVNWLDGYSGIDGKYGK